MKTAPSVINRQGYTYRRVGSFCSKSEAINYKSEIPHSLLIVCDDPKRFGADVRYHVYRRIAGGGQI